MQGLELRINMKKKIYILHGWAYSTERWTPFMDELKKGNFEVKMLKIPGLTAPLDEVWNIDNYVEWLHKILDKEENVVLLGHSNGGLISLAYTLRFPQKVANLIIMDSTGIYHKELQLQIKRYVLGSMAKVGKMITDSPTLKKLLYKIAGEHDYERANSISRQTMRNLIKIDFQERLKEIKIPTVIIWGGKDQVTPLKDAYVFNKKISNSKLFIIPSARHSPQLTNYQETAEIIMKNI